MTSETWKNNTPFFPSVEDHGTGNWNYLNQRNCYLELIELFMPIALQASHSNTFLSQPINSQWSDDGGAIFLEVSAKDSRFKCTIFSLLVLLVEIERTTKHLCQLPGVNYLSDTVLLCFCFKQVRFFHVDVCRINFACCAEQKTVNLEGRTIFNFFSKNRFPAKSTVDFQLFCKGKMKSAISFNRIFLRDLFGYRKRPQFFSHRLLKKHGFFVNKL